MNNCDYEPENVSSADWTDGREARSKFWIAAYTKPNCERKAARQLGLLDIEVYVPIQREIHHWSNRKKQIDQVAIPITIFAHIEEEQESLLSKSSLILRTLSMPGSRKSHHIPYKQIDKLKFFLGQSDVPVEFVQHVPKVGDKLCIVRGKLIGIEGITLTDLNGNKEIVISIDLLGGAKMSIETIEVEIIIN